ncbi:MAG: secretion system protein E [Lentisphaerales bacterium]|jgi:type IV pilus assembly protein PilB|nr:MAG: secretion system protein E [Lentisphaerales bacterium]
MAAKKGYSEAIGNILMKKGIINREQLDAAGEDAKGAGILLEKHLVTKRIVPPAEMTLAISEYLRMTPIRLAHFTPDDQLVKLIPRDILLRHLAFPVSRCGGSLTIALGDAFDMFALDELHTLTGLEVTPLVASEQEIAEALERFFPDESTGTGIEDILKDADSDLEIGHEPAQDDDDNQNIEMMIESAEGAPVVRMVNVILLEALRTGASDIHLEPQEKAIRLRYRIDGSLLESPSPPKNLQGAVLSRMKLMSGMDIAERRIPQDGRIKIRALGKEVDLRVNTLPTIFGEKVVMRILDRSSLMPNLAALGLDETAYRTMKHAISQPHGILLVTGPTGSGKTTTLYSCLQELNKPEVNIVTCEDPVEYQLEGINQVQINSFVGLTFASALRSVLRQSPDIILVGETRDSETAEIGVKAALTGHLVLSTLHTNDAPGAITRMIDMGVEPSLLASSLILAQAQRLVRKLCAACKTKIKSLPLKKLKLYGIDPKIFDGCTVYEAKGCPKCHGGGFKGRLAIMEVLRIDKEIRRGILKGISSREIAGMAAKKGMIMLRDIGLLKAREGITSIDAALEVTGGSE